MKDLFISLELIIEIVTTTTALVTVYFSLRSKLDSYIQNLELFRKEVSLMQKHLKDDEQKTTDKVVELDAKLHDIEVKMSQLVNKSELKAVEEKVTELEKNLNADFFDKITRLDESLSSINDEIKTLDKNVQKIAGYLEGMNQKKIV